MMREFIGHPEIEWASMDEMIRLQNILLQEHVAYCLARSPYYGDILRKAACPVADVTLDRLAELPLTSKEDLERHNDEFLAVPSREIADIVLTSGTTGKPTVIRYTERDLQRLAYNEKISFQGCGMTSDDGVLLTCTIDRCFVAGLAYLLGVRALGASAIRSGQAPLESQLDILQRLQPTVIVGVPSFLRKLGNCLEKDLARISSVRKLVCIGEPLRDAHMALSRLGRDIERLWSCPAYSTYASTETVSTFCECTAQAGGHLHPDLAIVEILDDEGRAVPEGEPGEVVLTPLGVEGMPLIRFQTGDISFLIQEPCVCGRTSPRLGPIVGRKRQMMKVRGTSLYPQMIFAALDEIDGVTEYYVSVASVDALSDEVTVHLALTETSQSVQAIEDKLQARLRVKPIVRVKTLEQIRDHVFLPSSRKPVRFEDQR